MKINYTEEQVQEAMDYYLRNGLGLTFDKVENFTLTSVRKPESIALTLDLTDVKPSDNLENIRKTTGSMTEILMSIAALTENTINSVMGTGSTAAAIDPLNVKHVPDDEEPEEAETPEEPAVVELPVEGDDVIDVPETDEEPEAAVEEPSAAKPKKKAAKKKAAEKVEPETEDTGEATEVEVVQTKPKKKVLSPDDAAPEPEVKVKEIPSADEEAEEPPKKAISSLFASVK